MNYQNKTVSELKAIAKERGLRRYSQMRKVELIAMLPARILDSSVPDIPAPVLQPSQYVPNQAKSKIREILEQAKSKIREWTDWLINHVPEQPQRIFNQTF